MASPRESARKERHRRRPPIDLAREELEVRLVPAIVAAAPVPVPALPPAVASLTMNPVVTILPAGGSSPNGFTPQQIRAAYGFSQTAFGSLPADGAGQTIAIVDAYDDPGLVGTTAANFATSDLAMFDRQFGLPDPPSFTKVNQDGSASSLPGTDPAGPNSPSGNWEFEEAMDVEWAHALAPAANIVLVEANSAGFGDLYQAITTAAGLPGVSTVSLSWGSSEFRGESYWDSEFLTPAGHQGVTFVAATGDAGAPGLYPAYSPNVVAAGGTSLQLGANGSYQAESAWPSSGGGTSSRESQPSYQKGVQSTGQRTIPDVAFQADRTIGVAVYDSYDSPGGSPWTTMGGTSLAAPAWAALVAVADQGRVAEGGTTLDGATQTLPALYSLPSADFHDVTTGGNGTNSAGPGYDQVTGLGSPIASRLIPDLAFYRMADHLVVTAQPPASAAAGSGFGLTVEVESPDGSLVTGASGTVTVALGNNPTGASLGGTLTATISGGVATFSGLTIDRAGSGYTLTLAGSGLTSAASASFDVAPAAGSQLVVVAEPPSSLAAGGTFGLTVDVQDAFGNLASGDDGTVSLALSGGPASAGLGGTLTASAVNGVATFSGLTIDRAGSGYAIEASEIGLTSATSTAMTVTPAAASQLVVTVQPPTTVTAGSGFGLTVAVEDPYGNLATGYAGPISVSLAGGPPGGSLGGSETASATGGVASFAGLDITRAGLGYAIEATGSGLGSTQSTAFDVSPAAPASLAIAAEPPASTIAGEPFGLAVAVEDAFGNLASGFDGNVSVAMAGGPPGATLGGGTTVAASNGVANFAGLILPRVGTGYALQATSPGLPGATTGAFRVLPATAARLVITGQPPSSVTAGSPFGLGVTVEDAYGNVVTGDSGNLTVAMAGGGGRSSLAGATTVKLDRGIGTFSGLTIDRAGGGDSLRVEAGGLTAMTTSAFRVVPGAPTHLLVTSQPPGGVAAGQSFGFGIQAEDAYGNVVTTFVGPVTATLAKDPAGGSLTGTVTTTAANGVAEFAGLTLDTAGSGYALKATSGGLSSGVTSPIAVSAGPASRLVLIAQPDGNVIRRQPFTLAVEAQDAFGNVATGFDGAVLAALTADSRHNRLAGEVAAQASGGEAVIAGARLSRPGHSYAITLTSSGLTPAATSVFSVTRPSHGMIPAARRADQAHPHGHVHAHAHFNAHVHVRARALPSFHLRRHGR